MYLCATRSFTCAFAHSFTCPLLIHPPFDSFTHHSFIHVFQIHSPYRVTLDGQDEGPTIARLEQLIQGKDRFVFNSTVCSHGTSCHSARMQRHTSLAQRSHVT